MKPGTLHLIQPTILPVRSRSGKAYRRTLHAVSESQHASGQSWSCHRRKVSGFLRVGTAGDAHRKGDMAWEVNQSRVDMELLFLASLFLQLK